jgi:aspartate/methionine/tyrosine aminotransferase
MTNSNSHFRKIEKAGTAYVSEKASELGFQFGHPDWSNLGQGSPDTGYIEGDLDRIEEIKLAQNDSNYAPIAGIKKLREVVATYYNELYRQNKTSKYTWKNVCIVPGGRSALSRVASVLGNINLGLVVPEYPAYKGIVEMFPQISPKVLVLEKKDGFKLDLLKYKNFIKENNLDAFLLSNPSNPTGRVLVKDELKELISISKQSGLTLIHDEFYSRFIYNLGNEASSAAIYVEDVNKDSVLIIDGITKSWRYPGWRISWVIAPEDVVENLSSSGSFMDGGANHPLQEASLSLFNFDDDFDSRKALRKEFQLKLNFMISSLKKLGFDLETEPESALYLWVNLDNLPDEINTGRKFFEKALQEKLIVIPGEFFDLNFDRQKSKKVKFENYIRLSYGPTMAELERGIEKIATLLRKYN